MRARMFLSALFKLRNIGILAAALILASLLSDPTALPNMFGVDGALPDSLTITGSIAVYIAFVIQTLLSKKFQTEFNQKEKFRNIKELNRLANRLSSEARRNSNNTYMQKLRKVINDKNEIFTSYSTGEHSYLKERIVEQTLNLVIAYLKLFNNFCIRSRELSSVDVGAVSARINNNTRKLSFAKDARMAEDVRKIIEMDEKLIGRLKDEKKELERISAKLDYMESTVNMFKHQIMSSIENEDMLEQLETAVNEAEALDAVLEDRRRNKLRM
ncbi:MAG: hypothetical protein GX279_08525 [Clostridiaceae bacterium]|jgi:hypothetical protein|nr:hypothetical protein [Clostridiaceae bacterium]